MTKPSQNRCKPAPLASSSLTAVTLRQQAEQQLFLLHVKARKTRVLTEAQRLVHELQVHQIELQMQNAELLESRAHTENLLEKYTDLYDFSPTGYFSLTADGRIELVNLTGASLLGQARADLNGRLLGRHLQAGQQPVLHAFLARVFSSVDRQTCEVTLGPDGGASRTVHLEAQHLPDQSTCRTVMRDVTERKQAGEKLRMSEIRYRRLFEAAHDGVLLLDPKTRKITDANPFMTVLLGYSRDQLIGKELFEIGLLKDAAVSQAMFRQLLQSHQVRYENLPLKARDGHPQEVEVVANLYQEDDHAIIQCNIRDITQRKQMEEALRASEVRFRTLFTLGPVAVYSCDASGKIQDFNDRAVELWGRKPAHHTGGEKFCGSFRMSRPDGRRLLHARCPMAEVLQGRIPEVRDTEVIIERPDRSRLTCIVNINPLKNEHGEIIGAINCFYDITERQRIATAERRTAVLAAANQEAKREIARSRVVELSLRKSEQSQRALLAESQLLHVQLRNLTRQIITAQEEERKKISRELHDDVMQTLVGINAALGALGKRAKVNPLTLRRNIAQTHRLVKTSLLAVHRFARDLRPAVLDDFGLIPALQAYCKNLETRRKFKVHLTTPNDLPGLENGKQTILFRVAQEALSNVARHARATVVELRITEIPGAVRIEIHDNGKSFHVRSVLAPGKSKRLGLVGMRERVEMVGGQLVIQSSPRRGTLVRADIPMDPSKTT